MFKEDFSQSYDKSRQLCFDENEFLKESFSVDAFLREHTNKASLEVMRDDLGTHLKTLRLAMIELINKDYEDFVNLSKDLVGLDTRIKKIQMPLEQIKSEVMEVKSELEEAITGLDNSLKQHKEIADKKRSLIHVNQVITCTKKLKSILGSSNNNNNNSSNYYKIELIERAAMEVNHMQFSLTKCNRDLSDSERKDAEEIKNKLMTALNTKFLHCLTNKNTFELAQCLKLYEGLDKKEDVELLVKNQVIAPKLSVIISEQALQQEPDGIACVYDEVIGFIERELMDLLTITTPRGNSSPVKGFNFLVNSFWPELEKRLSLPIMFAPGNPKLFHMRFTKSVELLCKLELLCGNLSSVMKLRQNGQYQHFIQKWNLPVYFKIRFQEIAGQLEKCLGEVSIERHVIPATEGTTYYLQSSSTMMEQVRKCWKNDVYLPELSHMFWKLSLQILSRYRMWVNETLTKEREYLEKRKPELGVLQTSYGMDNYQVRSRLDFLVCLFSDTNKLLVEMGTFLDDCKKKVPNKHLIEEELSISSREALKSMEESLPKITEAIVQVVVSESAVHLRQISQIPRLFRRTNRKSSTEPCEYVGHVLNFPKQFRDWKKHLSPEVLENWLTSVFNELTNQFYAAVNEVLTNAQKTEESLRKLKKKKENFPSKNTGDEEIRQQLVIDAHSFSDGIEKLQVRKENIAKLRELVQLVESARDKSEKQ